MKENDKNYIVVVSENMRANWRWLESQDRLNSFCWKFFSTKPILKIAAIKRTLASLSAVLFAFCQNGAVLVSHGPIMAFYVAIFNFLLGNKITHICYSFNFSTLPKGFAKKRMQLVFGRMLGKDDKLVVSSKMEVSLYADYFGISEDQIDFVLWGVGKVAVEPYKSDNPYVCAVGGNARDYRTLIEVAKDMTWLDFILVTRPNNLKGLKLPTNLRCLINIPVSEVNAIILGSDAMVLPLLDSNTPCGHVTLVRAFYLGVPVICTRSSGVVDYIEDGVTGLLCEHGSKVGMVTAIQKILQNKKLKTEISLNSRIFAEQFCTEENYVKHFLQVAGSNLSWESTYA